MHDTLSARLRAQTKALHTEAERSGVMAALLRGHATRVEYAALLAALLPVYDALERGLRLHEGHALVGPLARMRGLARSDALRADLDALTRLEVPIAAPQALALAYATHLDRLTQTEPIRLLAHAWLRYLGDLNGGQIVGRLLRESLQLPEEATQFYAFPLVDDPRATAESWRHTADALSLDEAARDAIVDEACDGFRRHIALFRALRQDAAGSPSSAA